MVQLTSLGKLGVGPEYELLSRARALRCTMGVHYPLIDDGVPRSHALGTEHLGMRLCVNLILD